MTARLNIGVNGARYVLDVSAELEPRMTLNVFADGPMQLLDQLEPGEAVLLADCLRVAAMAAREARTHGRRPAAPSVVVRGGPAADGTAT